MLPVTSLRAEVDHSEGSSMRPRDHTSRRRFIVQGGLAAGLAACGIARAGGVPGHPPEPSEVLERMLEGNRRFMNGQTSLLTRRRPEDFAALAEGQAPSAVVLGCADSRVAPELIFDQGVGDLFVVRVAGNVVTGAGPVVKGTIEFAVAELGVRLIMVLGHSQCGAVKAAITHIDSHDELPGSIGGLVDVIRPAVADAAGQAGDKLDNVIKANVRKCVERLQGLDPILAPLSKSGELKVVGATYELKTGKVEVLS
jgi:carbonic anhydrase